MTLSLGPVIGTLGGGVEEIPVSVAGSGTGGIEYPIATVDAGDGALIAITGTVTEGNTSSTARPNIRIGTLTFGDPEDDLSAPGSVIGGLFAGTVEVALVSRHAFESTIVGTLYVARL